MRILEIKNSLVKISYDVEDNLALSGFVIIEDKNSPYVAQVVNLKAENGRNYAVLKLLFTFNEEGVLKPYDGTIPSVEASVTFLPTEELLEVIPVEAPVYLGVLANKETPFKVDSSVFESNMLICSNNVDNTSKLLSNILPQLVDLGEKVVLLDVNGDFTAEDSFVFGKDFSLPLNKQFLNFIFENDLDGVAPVSKAVIQDIFKEVQDYIESLPEGFLPIDLFINVVHEQYKETGIPELVLLKNKLLNYQEKNIFASVGESVSLFRDKVAHSDMLIVDVSNVDVKLQKLLIFHMFDNISTVNSNTFVLLSMNNDVADKRLLRKTLEYGNIYTTLVCPHEFKYLPDLKQIIQNMILFAPQTLQHDFANYNTFLSKLNADEFIVYGTATHQIPFIIQFKSFEDIKDSSAEDDGHNVVEEIVVNEEDSNNAVEALGVIEAEVVQPQIVSEENQELINEVQDIISDVEGSMTTEIVVESSTDENIESFSDEVSVVEESISEQEINVVSGDVDVTETVNSSTDENTLVDGELTFEQEALEERELVEEQIAQDVDASFYNKFEEESLDSENDINPEIFDEEEPDSALTENDLDYIQSMPIDEQEQETYSTEDFSEEFEERLEMPQEADVMSDEVIDDFDTSDADSMDFVDDDSDSDEQQMVPVYTPEEFSDEANDNADMYLAGDVVSHPKYGQGVVEKMINYGNKTLCSISFVNIGRRLLDPSLSELTLVSRDGAVYGQ